MDYDAFNDALLNESRSIGGSIKSDEVQKGNRARAALIEGFEQARESGDIDTLLELERICLEHELDHNTNSTTMRSSLEQAIEGVNAAAAALSDVRDPAHYVRVCKRHYTLPKNQVGGLPRDQARQFFRSHATRLNNLTKARLGESEKAVLSTRLENIRSMEQLYIALQREALEQNRVRENRKEFVLSGQAGLWRGAGASF